MINVRMYILYSHRTLGHLEALYCPHSGISGPKVTPMCLVQRLVGIKDLEMKDVRRGCDEGESLCIESMD